MLSTARRGNGGLFYDNEIDAFGCGGVFFGEDEGLGGMLVEFASGDPEVVLRLALAGLLGKGDDDVFSRLKAAEGSNAVRVVSAFVWRRCTERPA